MNRVQDEHINKASIDTLSAHPFTATDQHSLKETPPTKEQFISRLTGQPPTDEVRPKALGVHHLKFGVSNLDISIAWYERVLGAQRIASLDHIRSDGTRFAIICRLADWSGLFLELRHSPRQALKDRGWDTVTLLVEGRRDLVHWAAWLDRWTTHSPVLTGPRGWVVVFEDPDGRRIRIYTQEKHDGTENTSTDIHWLDEI